MLKLSTILVFATLLLWTANTHGDVKKVFASELLELNTREWRNMIKNTVDYWWLANGQFETDEVTVLGDWNFDQVVFKDDMPWFVVFYGQYCSPCEELKPQYERLARALKGKANFGKVDITSSS